MLQSLGIPQTSIQELLIFAGDNNRVRQQLDQTLTFYPIVLDEVVDVELFQVFIQANFLSGNNNAITQVVNQVAPRIALFENQLTGDVPADLTLTFDEFINNDGVLDTVQSATQSVDILGDDNQVIQAAEQSILDLSFFDLRVPNPLAGAATGDINQFLANIANSEILDGLQFAFQEIIIEGSGNFVEQRIEQAIAAFVVLDEAALAQLNNAEASPIQFSIQESFGEVAATDTDNNFIEQEINQTLVFDPRFVLDFDAVIDNSNGTRLEDFTFAIDDFLERITNELEVLATQNIVQENLITGNENQDNASSKQQTILTETSELIFGDREGNVIEAGVTVTATGLVDGIDDLIFVGGGSDLVDLTAAPLDFFLRIRL
ncbi:MAG: hypothetical protein HC890_00610 [Chloroflexaceae bacterium]|nr:hypothetical protein [Chloroflexaceae bacterium]